MSRSGRGQSTGAFFLVATPIGNLEDITLRALRVLREADVILAEDTRRARILLAHHGIRARPVSLHAHNERARVAAVLERLRKGARVALVSDAGTPLISDPGERLCAAALAEGHRLVPVPGASAVLAALSLSGLPVAPFAFLGFLPRRAGARRELLLGYRGRPETLVLFESPRRLAGTLGALQEVLGDRPAAVARELTKLHEEVVRGPLSELLGRFAEGARGEVTVVVSGAPPAEAQEDALAGEDLEQAIRELLAAGHSPRQVAATLAHGRARPRREIYARAVALRGDVPRRRRGRT